MKPNEFYGTPMRDIEAAKRWRCWKRRFLWVAFSGAFVAGYLFHWLVAKW